MNILKLTVSPISTNSSTLNIILSIAHEAIELPTYFMPVLLNKYLNITSFDMYISLLFVVPLIFIILTKIKVNIKINSELFRNISLYIYVSHGVFLIITRAILEYLNLNAIKGISSIKFLIVSSTSIIFSILIIKAKQALIKIKNIYMVG